jgi:hypothetical protein
VELKYAPETGTPSALIQLKVNGTQRCQVTVNKWGLQRSLQIANQLYKDFVDGKVELRDIYSWRNQLEGEMALQDVKDNFAKNTANAAAGKDEEVGPKAGFTTPFSALELVIRKHLVGLAKEDHKREKGTATFLKKTASPKERAIALEAKIEEGIAAAEREEGSAATAAGRSEVVENENKDQDEVGETPTEKEEEEEEEEQDEEEIENEDDEEEDENEDEEEDEPQ